jgi:hypothetical protein
MILYIGSKTHILGYFELFRYCMKVGAKRADLVPLVHKFAKWSSIGLFNNERTQSTLSDPKLMFWGRFEPFRYCPKVSAKWAELVPLTHKFAKGICVRIFRNERTRSTRSDTKLIFWGRFEPFLYCTKVGAKPAELVPLTHKFAKQSCVRIFHIKRTWFSTLDPKLMF